MRGADFASLTAFAAVVEQGSFVRAAAHLGVTPSALSQTIRQLEERMGVRLLNRTTRSVAPTAVGERLHARLTPAIEELDGAMAEAVATHGRSTEPCASTCRGRRRWACWPSGSAGSTAATRT